MNLHDLLRQLFTFYCFVNLILFPNAVEPLVTHTYGEVRRAIIYKIINCQNLSRQMTLTDSVSVIIYVLSKVCPNCNVYGLN